MEDLFDDIDSLPQDVQDILNFFADGDNTYTVCAELEAQLNAVGYGIEWGLDAIPYNLHKL